MGQAQASSNTAMILLNNKFGALPEDLKQAILNANPPLHSNNPFNIETISKLIGLPHFILRNKNRHQSFND